MENKILDKVQKLLKLSESPNIEESKLAMEKAHQLLKEHNLSISDIHEKSDLIENSFGHSRRIVNWKKSLINAICQYNYCGLLLKGQVHSDSYFALYGREDNIAVTKAMYEYLVNAIERIAKEERKNNSYFNLNDFKSGAVITISTRLRDLRIEESDCTSLACVSKEAEDFMRKNNPNTQRVSLKVHNSSSTNLGFTKADSISLNSQINNGRVVRDYIA
jgi:hypothetical protein